MADKLFLIRHGSTLVNESAKLLSAGDPGLSTRGNKQCDALVEKIGQVECEVVWTSPAVRAIQTAESLRAALNLKVAVSHELKERDLGDWEGLSREEIIRRRKALRLRCEDLTQDWEGCNGVEQDEEVFRRVSRFVEEVTRRQPGHVVIVSHAGVIKSFVYSILELPQHRNFAFRITLGGYAVLERRKGYWELAELWPNPFAAPPAIV
ncbi:histidine phosphatase family protein [Nocardiopsis sp. FR4]|uniref:histidine phosphatase family protein n=1 Tax=Nocardiopsis sp. FR4 TaxID=2605985 RepID=UPI00135A808D|nr:histidine phosphatase family protein [Nocardiopsis sp. FR4]